MTGSSGAAAGRSFLTRRAWLQATAGAPLLARRTLADAYSNPVKIKGVETIALEDPGKYNFTLVKVKTDAGVEGLGQAESPALIIDAIVRYREGLEYLLNGENPLEVERLWQKMYHGARHWGRRGIVIAAIGAVETALWDIAGKLLNRPVAELVWRSFASLKTAPQIKTRIRPYATVYLPGDNEREMRERFQTAVDRGFRAVKLEEVPGGFANVDSATDVRVVRLIREIIGPDRELMIDVQNVWNDVGTAVESCKAIEPFRIYFIEAPFPPDNVEALKRLADSTPIRIAVGDWGFTTRFDYFDLMDRGGVDVVQPSTVRSGGMAEILKIAEAAFRKGVSCIPHCWCHMIGVAAAVQLAAVIPNMPYIEYPVAFPNSPLISELLVPSLAPDKEGWIELPRRPGLGFELNQDLVKRYRVQPA
jgi:L-alanine-DL-glutamate epimerase-like enolase superfamily enzyme